MLLLLLAVGVILVGAVNRLGPSATRVVRPQVLRVVDLVWRTVTSVGTTLPGSTPERDDEAIVVVDSWRTPGLELQLPIPAAEIERVETSHDAALEVIEADGFLGVPYVQAARFVTR